MNVYSRQLVLSLLMIRFGRSPAVSHFVITLHMNHYACAIKRGHLLIRRRRDERHTPHVCVFVLIHIHVSCIRMKLCVSYVYVLVVFLGYVHAIVDQIISCCVGWARYERETG